MPGAHRSRRAVFGGIVALAAAASCDTQARKDAKPSPNVVDARSLSVVADSRTDCAGALNAALARMGPDQILQLPDGEIVLGHPVVVPARATLRGAGPNTRLIGRHSGTLLTVNGPLVSIGGLALASGQGGLAVSLSAQASNTTIEDALITSAGGSGDGIRTSGTGSFVLRRTTLADVMTGIEVLGPTPSLVMVGCEIRRWSQRAVHLVAGPRGGVEKVLISDCKVLQFRPGRAPGQPIAIAGTARDTLHGSVTITRTTVLGPGRSFTAPLQGTADNIWVSAARECTISENTSMFGGDMGITVSGVVGKGAILGNVCVANDAAGIAVGSAASVSVGPVAISGNVLLSNGVNRNKDRTDATRSGVRVLQGAHGLNVNGNAIGNLTGRVTQLFGISSNLPGSETLGGNIDMGGLRARVHMAGNATRPAGAWNSSATDRAAVLARLGPLPQPSVG